MRTFEEWRNNDFFPEDRGMITLEMAWNAALTAANERIKVLEDKVELLATSSACNEWDLKIEREVSDKLEKALRNFVNDILPNDPNDSLWEEARAALAEVAAIRAKQQPTT